MDHEVEALAKELRLDEARALSLERGDVVRALELAIEARDAAGTREVVRALGGRDETTARKARAVAVRMRDPFAEACVVEATRDGDDAALLFERAEAWADAARIHTARGDVAKAGRALERQLQRDPTDVAARKALANILLQVGHADACLRTLGSVAEDDEVDALRARAHAALGLADGPAQPQQAEDSPLLFGRYEVVREVASTPSSRVLEARDRLDPVNPRVALKIFTGTGHAGAGRDALARFRREVEALSLIDAKAVLRPRAFLAEGPTLVLPWAAGGNVETLLQRGLPSPRRAAEIMLRVLEALDAAHRRGIIHRDVKPANILLDEAGGAFLADFGVAHLSDVSATATAGVIGTARFMSPEQRRGEPATPRSDLYSVGVVFADLLGVDPSAPPELPPPVQTLLDELLSDDDAARPPDAAQVVARIRAIGWPEDPFTTRRSLPPSLRSTPPRSERFEPRGALVRDRLLERDELRVGPDDPRYPLCCALATLSHPSLPRVLASEGDVLRVEAWEGAPATRLSPDERRELAAALTLLHRAGISHGAVSSAVVRTPRAIVLGVGHGEGSPAQDLAALERL